MNQLELCRLMAKTWKDNGGDAMGFHWLQDTIRMEILKLEMPPPSLELPFSDSISEKHDAAR